MRRRTLTNVALLLVAAGLAVFIALRPDNPPDVELEPLSNENPRAVSRIRLKLGTGATMELRRYDGVWDLIDPIRIAANDIRVQALSRVLEAPVYWRIDFAPQRLAQFGLAPPRARLLLDGTEILFGDTEPLYGRRYLLYDGKVAMVGDTFFSPLSASPANYVNLAPLGRDPQLRAIFLSDVRVFQDAGDWRLDSDDGKVAAESITRLVDAWRYARATAVRPYEPSLDWNDVIRVVLTDGILRFDLARTEYELILGRPDLGIQYHLTKSAGERLLGFASPDG